MNYRCSVCGCYLDPGESRICEECDQKRKWVQQMRKHPQDQDTAKAMTSTQVHNTMVFLGKERGKCI